MLHTVIERVNGIPVQRAGSQYFTRTLSIRPRARNLRDRYNSTYSTNFDPTHAASAHQVAEDAVISVAEAVLNARLIAYIEAKTPKQAAKRPARKTRDRASAAVLANLVQQAGR